MISVRRRARPNVPSKAYACRKPSSDVAPDKLEERAEQL
jgi:hypothetical protein